MTLKRPIVFTNGVFDILHRGHVHYLEQARVLGACLIVAINSDESVRRLGKGQDRPFNTEQDRKAMLRALNCVDMVLSFNEDTPIELIRFFQPEVLVKGGDYTEDQIAGAKEVRSWGGRVVTIPFEYQRSTTALVERIRSAA